MRHALCLLACLLFAVPVAAQESDRQVRQRLWWTLSQARNAATAQTAALAHIQAAYDAVHARIVADSIADLTPITPPPPPVTPPAPPVDTTDVPVPPAPMPVAPFSPPPGWTVLTDYRWPALNGSGWGYIQRGGDLGFIQAVSDPDMGTAAEMVYRQGFPSGNDPGVLWHEGVRGHSGFYAAFRVRFSDNWTHQDPAIKFFFLMADGWNMYIQPMSRTPAWVEQYGLNAGTWTLGRQGWPGGGEAGDGLPVWTTEPWSNINHEAAAVAWDRWQTVEIQVLRGSGGFDGVIRMWVDGVLTAEHTQVRIPSGGFSNLHFAGTYGGGNIPTVPADQWIRISHTMIAVPE